MTEGSIAERLAGQHVLVTGVTGFVGEALLHLMLAEVPDVRMSVLVRPKGSTTGADRTAKLLEKPIFADIVEAAGGVEALMAARVAVVDGDLADVPTLPSDIDAVVHCAGDVSFDPPVDEGFTTNVVGVRDLLDRIDEASQDSGRDIHYVHISTAYVAGRRRGSIPEAPVEHDVDLDRELEWGLGQRRLVEDTSRGAELLTKERKKAEKEHSRAGLLTAARATEAARKQWVKDELVRIGTERARSLGWTDCYTFTKAMGERVVELWASDAAGKRRASIVRPSIIESALERPHVGWIEGFKMAEPLILAYGRGELPEFPASADTIVDIVPVDHVVAAIVAVLAHPPEPGDVGYFHLSSGDRNPLTFNVLYNSVRTFFDHHPFTAGDRGAARLPEWRFPGARSVERLLSTSEKAWKVADYAIGHAPRSDRARELARKLHQQGRRLEFLRRYLNLYMEYATAELRFSDKQTMALFDSLSEADRATFAFDTSVIDWPHYFIEVHCPAVTAPVRRLDELRALRKKPASTDAADRRQGGDRRRSVLRHGRHAALVQRHRDLPLGAPARARRHRPARRAQPDRVQGAEPGPGRAPLAQRLPARRSTASTRAPGSTDLNEVADDFLTSHVLSRLSPDAVRRIRQHRAAGHQTVLITGAIRPLTRPLIPLFDHIEAADLAVDSRGICTGHLASSPLVGESRGAWMKSYAAEHGIDMAASFGYADSHSDLPLLEAIGNPVAVKPDVALYRHARRSHWDVVDWASPTGATRGLDPAKTGA